MLEHALCHFLMAVFSGMDMSHFMSSSLGCLHFGAIMNSAAVNICMHVMCVHFLCF